MTRRSAYRDFWANVGNRFPDLDGAASTRFYAENEQRLFDEHRIEIPTMGLNDDLLRISIASYTEREDVERLLDALPGALAS